MTQYFIKFDSQKKIWEFIRNNKHALRRQSLKNALGFAALTGAAITAAQAQDS